jgi:intracellular multiplication protein IcmL
MKYKGLQLVLERHAFYYDKYRLAIVAFLCLLILNAVLLGGIVYRVTHPTPPEFFATTSDGRIINIHPLSDPVVTDDFVLQWSADVARASFRLDFVNWREGLQQLASNFTPPGWAWFLQQLKSSNNLETIKQLKMVVDAKITGAPQLLRKAVIGGRYAWEVQIPLLVTYQNQRRRITQTVMLTMVVLRMPVQDYPQRIAVNNFIADTGARVS